MEVRKTWRRGSSRVTPQVAGAPPHAFCCGIELSHLNHRVEPHCPQLPTATACLILTLVAAMSIAGPIRSTLETSAEAREDVFAKAAGVIGREKLNSGRVKLFRIIGSSMSIPNTAGMRTSLVQDFLQLGVSWLYVGHDYVGSVLSLSLSVPCTCISVPFDTWAAG